MIANTKRDGSVRDPYEEEKILRLFVIIPKSWKEDDLRKEFDVSNMTIIYKIRSYQSMYNAGP